MTVQLAFVYERQGKLFLRTSSKTTLGSWTEVGECTTLDRGAAPEVLGDAVRKHLATSTTGVPFQGRGAPKVPDLLVQAAKVGSRRTFDRSAKCVSVEADSGQVVISPHKNDMPGFTVITGSESRLPASAAVADLGREIQLALELSR
jgi:hypothetical protein